MQCQWKDKVLGITESHFTDLALEIFRFQYRYNDLYRQYVDLLHGGGRDVDSLERIPYLPISFFKSHQVKTTSFEAAAVFESSGTTGTVSSKHFVKEINLYQAGFTKGFELFYGPARDWSIIGLLPSYLERKNSSLVYMVHELITQSEDPGSGFYLNEFDELLQVLTALRKAEKKTLLIGVTFGLLDFAESCQSLFSPGLFDHTTIMETGGMKGRRREMLRTEVHNVLKKAFGVSYIHSEYGMTELLSQAYSGGDGLFSCPPWMRVMVRDEEDPLDIHASLKGRPGSLTGALNIIDLANIYSCSFIATDDVGKIHPGNSFEVLGRMDNSDIRGCSLMLDAR